MRTAGYVRQHAGTSYSERQQADEFVAKIGRAVMFDDLARTAMLKTLAGGFASLSTNQRTYVMQRAIPALTSLTIVFEIATIFGPYVKLSL